MELNDQPVLTTERLSIRDLKEIDRYNLLKLRSNDEVNEYLNRNSSHSLNDIDIFITKIRETVRIRQGLYWAITLKNSPHLIGTVCYWNLNYLTGTAELGYELLPEHQGNSLMKEALVMVIEYGWDTMGLKTIIAIMHPGNKRSAKLLTKLGFTPVPHHQYVSASDADGLRVYAFSK